MNSPRRTVRAVICVLLGMAVCGVVAYFQVRYREATAGVLKLVSSQERAGERVCRFRYTIPYRHKIVFAMKEYEDEQGGAGVCDVDSVGEAGEQELVISTKQGPGPSHIKIMAPRGGFSEEDEQPSPDEFPHKFHGPLAAKLEPGKKVPVYVWCENRKKTRGFSRGDSVDRIVRANDRVKVLVVELRREEDDKRP